jgi:hypothetical protein
VKAATCKADKCRDFRSRNIGDFCRIHCVPRILTRSPAVVWFGATLLFSGFFSAGGETAVTTVENHVRAFRMAFFGGGGGGGREGESQAWRQAMHSSRG